MLKSKRRSIGDAVQLAQPVKPQLRFEVSSMRVKIDAPLDLVWEIIEKNDELEW